MTFGEPDRIFFMPHWIWGSTVERWHSEGLPRDVHMDEYFGFDRYQTIPIHLGLLPPFDVEVYHEDDDYKVYRRGDGCIVKEFKRRPEMSMPQWLDFSLKSWETWEREFKPRLKPESPARYPLWWEDYVRVVRDRDYPLGISAGSFFGWPRNWIGLENLALLFFDDPELVREICTSIADFVIRTIERAVDEIRPDFALFWEDMAMKSGPLCSPDQFREFMLPCYKRVCDLLDSYGVTVRLVDSDGNNDAITPLFLEGGVTGIYPLEIAADTDPVALRKQYGQRLMMFGGVDKRALARGREAIDQEIIPKVPWLISQGGYTPFVDHAVPADVSLENFTYYWNLVKEIAKDPWRYVA
jgi:uroporphyrinogen decarboxylase